MKTCFIINKVTDFVLSVGKVGRGSKHYRVKSADLHFLTLIFLLTGYDEPVFSLIMQSFSL